MTRTPRRAALVQALFVTFLWSTSWVLIKVGLEAIPALTFAGLRYVLATLLLLPLALRGGLFGALRALAARERLELALLGVVLYALTQGAQFVALALLPAATVSLVLSFTPVLVAGLATATLREPLTRGQWLGVGLAAGGALVYFGAAAWPSGRWAGLTVATVGLFANALAAVLGRAVARRGTLRPLDVTVSSMAVGATLLLAVGVGVQGLPALDAQGWAIVTWLAVVNTALAFVLWNRSLRGLSATESSVVNNTMLVQIALLACLVLREPISAGGWTGIALVVAGTLAVQLRR